MGAESCQRKSQNSSITWTPNGVCTYEGKMSMITRTIRASEACRLLKDALCANSVEGIIEYQGDEAFYRFVVEIEPGQVAYSAYRASRSGKSQGGSALPAALSHDLLPAWNAFAAAIMTGLGVDQAYQRYLTERSGLTVSGDTAPDWDELRTNKPEVAAAWADAANALIAAL